MALPMACIVVVVLTVLLVKQKIITPPSTSRLCNTSECQEHAQYVRRAMNFSVLPCDDFHAFVCSNWKADKGYGGGTDQDTRGEMQYQNVPLLLKKEAHHFKATSKLSAMLSKCLNRTASDNTYSLETMKNFTKDRGILWPSNLSKGIHALDVLLDFVINWLTPMWFRLRVKKVNSTARIYLTDAAATLATYTFLLDYILLAGEQASYDAFAKLYNQSQNTNPQEIAELFQINKYVSAALMNTNNAPNKTLAILKISDIETFTPAIPKNTWVELLNKHTAGAFVVNDATEVFLDNSGLLVTIGQLFGNFTSTQLLRQISWFFNILNADVATQDSYTLLQSPNMYEALGRVSCHLGLDERYNLLLAAENTASNFPAYERKAVNVMLQSIIENATLMLSHDATWIDDEGRREARLKVPKIKVDWIARSTSSQLRRKPVDIPFSYDGYYI